MYVENWKTEEVCLRGFVSQCFKKNDEEKHKNFLASLATLLHCCTGAKNLECNCCQAQCLCVPDVVEAVGFCFPEMYHIYSKQRESAAQIEQWPINVWLILEVVALELFILKLALHELTILF